jgi:GT2 family glycosyltransferase
VGVHASLKNSSTPALSSARTELVSIVAVIVIYKVAAEQCISLQSLQKSASLAVDQGVRLTILVVDNSPGSFASNATLPPDVQYLACPDNLGLANAYNQGILLSQRCGAGWLLTLDQDTELPANFLALMAEYARRYRHDSSVAAVLPQVLAGETPLSPMFYRWDALPTWFPRGYVGIPRLPVFGINSASMIRVDALMQAGGYDPMFWLDCSDMAIFYRLHRLGKQMLVVGDVEVQHELSLKDLQSRVSPQRYRNILLAESAFWDAEMTLAAGLERTGRLAMRLLRQIRRRNDR